MRGWVVSGYDYDDDDGGGKTWQNSSKNTIIIKFKFKTLLVFFSTKMSFYYHSRGFVVVFVVLSLTKQFFFKICHLFTVFISILNPTTTIRNKNKKSKKKQQQQKKWRETKFISFFILVIVSYLFKNSFLFRDKIRN